MTTAGATVSAGAKTKSTCSVSPSATVVAHSSAVVTSVPSSKIRGADAKAPSSMVTVTAPPRGETRVKAPAPSVKATSPLSRLKPTPGAGCQDSSSTRPWITAPASKSMAAYAAVVWASYWVAMSAGLREW